MPAVANSLDNISNPNLKEFTSNELRRGAPSLYTTSRVLYREAIETLESGDWEKAREKLTLCATISGDYADPMFTLARVELMHAHPDFLYHLIEGIKRTAGNYHRQSLLAINLLFLIVCATTVTLLMAMVILLWKYWRLIEHRINESYSKRFAFPPGRFIGSLIIISLLFMRLGIAIYASLLILSLWPVINKRERTALSFLTVLVIAFSLSAPFSNVLIPAVDEGSITRRFSMMNMSGVDGELYNSIRTIDNRDFIAEKDFALGTLNYRLGRYDMARQALLSSVSRRSDFPQAYLNLGNVYFMQADYNKALAGYQSVIAIDSTSALAHFNIGQAYINKMLFAQSSRALKKASVEGIEKYRAGHPAVMLRDLTVYDEGFPTTELWSIAWRESRGQNDILFDKLLRPYLLIPFGWLGYVLAAALMTAMVLSRKTLALFTAFNCENCGSATCPECSEDTTGLRLCADCSKTIRGLSSVKVMEALLRHRRQKVSGSRSSRKRLKTAFVPGSTWLMSGKTHRGIIAIYVEVSAALSLIWAGMYFPDPRGLPLTDPFFRVIFLISVILVVHLISLRVRPAREQKNFRVLPPDFRIDPVVEKETATERPASVEPKTNDQRFETFLDSL